MNNYLITGGAGFVGCTLVRKLLERGDKIIVYDNFSFGKKENIRINHRNLKIIKGDIADRKMLYRAVKVNRPNIVVHLAALHFIPYCNAHTYDTIKVNVVGTQNLLETCRKSSVKKILFASSAAVYSKKNKANKETDTLDAIDIYGISKIFMEQIVNLYMAETEKVCIILRLFNIYGPYETNPHLIPRIMEQYAEKKDKIKLGNLTPKRDYIYVEDVADVITELASDRVRKSNTYNIGTGYEYSVIKVVELLNKITGRNVRVESIAKLRREVEREHLLADISKIKKDIGWKPRYSMLQGLKKTAVFYKLI